MSGWASWSDLGSLKAGAGRIPLGKVGMRKVSVPPRQNLLVLGASGSWKTTAIAGPALRAWPGPVLATSIKDDLVTLTRHARRHPTYVFDPTSADTDCWSPVVGCGDWRHALRMAAWLVEAAQFSEGHGDPIWPGWAEMMLAPLLHAGARKPTTMAGVVSWVKRRAFKEVAAALPGESPAAEAWLSIITLEQRQLSSIISTLDQILKAFADPIVAAATDHSDFAIGDLLARRGTLYLSGPRSEQARLRPVLTALTRAVIAYAEDHAPLDPPLLLVLDELANIAPLADLGGLASSCLGLGIVLLSVFQDLAQIEGRYGHSEARSIRSNHRTWVALPTGMHDAGTLSELSQMCGTRDLAVRNSDGSTTRRTVPLMTPGDLAQLPLGHGILFADSCPPARLRLVSG